MDLPRGRGLGSREFGWDLTESDFGRREDRSEGGRALCEGTGDRVRSVDTTRLGIEGTGGIGVEGMLS